MSEASNVLVDNTADLAINLPQDADSRLSGCAYVDHGEVLPACFS